MLLGCLFSLRTLREPLLDEFSVSLGTLTLRTKLIAIVESFLRLSFLLLEAVSQGLTCLDQLSDDISLLLDGILQLLLLLLGVV